MYFLKQVIAIEVTPQTVSDRYEATTTCHMICKVCVSRQKSSQHLRLCLDLLASCTGLQSVSYCHPCWKCHSVPSVICAMSSSEQLCVCVCSTCCSSCGACRVFTDYCHLTCFFYILIFLNWISGFLKLFFISYYI